MAVRPLIGAPATPRGREGSISPQPWAVALRPDEGRWSRRMPFPRASKALRVSPCSTSPACAPGRPACASSPTGAPTSSRSRRRPGRKSRWAAPREGSDFQNLHRNKRSVTLNLKAPEGLAAFKRMVEEGRRGGGEFPARREEAARHRLQGAGAGSIRASSMPASPASARTGPTLTGPASTRSRRAWAG